MQTQTKKLTLAYRQAKEGFTIIEVLIVLAIAGLIFLIVFLAVPALQRNSRNTSRQADVSGLLAGFNEFAANNNGQMPDTVAWASPTLTLSRSAGGTTAQVRFGFYTGGTGGGQGQVQLGTGAAGALATTSANDRIRAQVAAACDSSGNGAAIAASPRQVAVQYLTETGGGTYGPRCQDS